MYDHFRDKNEYNRKSQFETYRRLEELTERMFLAWNFVKVYRSEIGNWEPCDFGVSKGNREYEVYVKYYRSLKVSLHNLRLPFKEQKVSLKEGVSCNTGRVRLLVVYGLTNDSLRKYIKDKYKVITLDLSNLLWMAAIDEQIESEIKSLLDFSVVDVVPVPPVGLNLNKKLLDGRSANINYEKESDRLIRKLQSWVPRDNAYTVYENLCVDILKYLFDDELALWKVQERTYDNLYRYDLVCRIKDGGVSGFWKTIEQFFNSKYVIFEFKNYKEPITQREIYTTEKYLYLKALRGVAIIISCYGTDNNAEKAIRGTLRENGKLILSVDNQGLIEMIEAKIKGREPSGFLYDQLDTMLADLEK